jgi:hypothetical protein
MPFPANPLEVALTQAKAGRLPTDQLLNAIAAGTLWVPLPAGADAHGNTQLPIMLLEGHRYVAAYTSADQYTVGAGDLAHMQLTGRQLAALMAEELGLAVNPGAEHGLPVRPDGMRVIRGGRVTVPAGTRLRLGAPDPEPDHLIAALTTRFVDVPALLEARRALVQVGDQQPALLIGIQVDPAANGERREIIAVVDAAVAQSPPPYPVNTIFLDDVADPIGRWMLEHTTPIYRRPGPGT